MTAISIYTDPHLAVVYEALNTPGPDDAFYLTLAGTRPISILDVGCGTGRLACTLAVRGHNVTGAEPSAAMLDIARTRPNSERVQWLQSTAADLSLNARFDLIIMTGHVFQVFLKDEEIRAALHALHGHLAPNGRLAFETRNPLVEKWNDWTEAKTSTVVDVPNLGPVQVHQATTRVEGQIVTYETHFRFQDGETVVAPDTLRFVTREQLATFLNEAGFPQLTFYGDWDRSPFTPTSPEIIAVAAVQ